MTDAEGLGLDAIDAVPDEDALAERVAGVDQARTERTPAFHRRRVGTTVFQTEQRPARRQQRDRHQAQEPPPPRTAPHRSFFFWVLSVGPVRFTGFYWVSFDYTVSPSFNVHLFELLFFLRLPRF